MYQLTQKEMVLLYNIKNKPFTPKLKSILLKLGMKIKVVDASDYNLPIHSLISKGAPAAAVPSNEQLPFTDEMMIMAGFTNARLDVFLKALRKEGIRIPLKAVLTPQNSSWTSYQLYNELVDEHNKMMELEASKLQK